MTTEIPPTIAALANQLNVLSQRGFKLETLFDVGANVGDWALAAQNCLPDARIEMFEPLAGRLEELDAQAKHDQIVHGTLHDIALSDETGTTEIKVLAELGVGSSILVRASDHDRGFEIKTCPAWRLDDYIAERNLPQPDFIKIDAQAGELKILKGAENTLKECKFLFLEVWARRVYGPDTPLFHEIATHLYGQNFMMYDMFIEDNGRDPDGTLRYFDAMFINRDCSSFPAWAL